MDDKNFVSASEISKLAENITNPEILNTLPITQYGLNNMINSNQKHFSEIANEAYEKNEKQRRDIQRTADNTGKIKEDVKRIDDLLKSESEERIKADNENKKFVIQMDEENKTFTKRLNKPSFILGLLGTIFGGIAAIGTIIAIFI